MLKQNLLILFTLFSFSLLPAREATAEQAGSANTPESQQYISAHAQLAVQEMNVSGIPASIKLAQGILESAWGKSDAAVLHNSHFGIKCKEWRGDYFMKVDDDYDEQGRLIESCFRAYEKTADSYRDHSEFLTSSSRYSELFTYAPTDYVSWAIGLQKCGYATNPTYAIKLIDLIEKYQLYKYDKKPEQPVYAAESNSVVTPPAPVLIPERYNRHNVTPDNREMRFEQTTPQNQIPQPTPRTEQIITDVNNADELPPSSAASPPADVNEKLVITFGRSYSNRYQQLARQPRTRSSQRR